MISRNIEKWTRKDFIAAARRCGYENNAAPLTRLIIEAGRKASRKTLEEAFTAGFHMNPHNH